MLAKILSVNKESPLRILLYKIAIILGKLQNHHSSYKLK